jgi:dihydrofolate reductase
MPERSQLPLLPPLPAGSLAAVVAVGRGGAIGSSGTLGWDAPEDMAHFRLVTTGHALIMGATTWESIGRPLPRRTLIVVSRRTLALPPGVHLRSSPQAALRLARELDSQPMLVGGAQLYRELLGDCSRIWLTNIDVDVAGADVFFDEPDPEVWEEVASWPGTDGRLRFSVLDRR